MSLLTVVAGPTGGAFATAKSKGTEGVKKRLAGLIILQVDRLYRLLFHYDFIFTIYFYIVMMALDFKLSDFIMKYSILLRLFYRSLL